MPKRKSKHAKELKRLGFKKVTLESPTIRVIRNGREVPQAELERMRASVQMPPSFAREPHIKPPVTRATDETGQDWEAPGHIDLTPLGFMDNIAWARQVGLLKKTH